MKNYLILSTMFFASLFSRGAEMDCLPEFSILGATSVCQGEEISFSLPEENYTSISWSIDGQTVSTEPVLTWSFPLPGVITIEVAANTDLCTYTNTLSLTVQSGPVVDISIWGNTINTFPLQASYQWYYGDQLIEGATGGAYYATASGDYSLYVWNTDGCYSVFDIQLELCPPPPAVFGNTEFCGQNFNEFWTETEQPVMYWLVDGNNYDTGLSTSIAINNPGTHTVSLTVGNDICTSTTEVEVTATGIPQVSLSNSILSTDFTGISYQWYLGGNAIEGATAQSVSVTGPGFYTVVVTVNENCEVESDEVFIPVHVAEESLFAFNVFPNPFSDQLQITIGTSTDFPASVQLTDITGKKLAQITIYSETQAIELQHLPAGIYLLQFIDNGNRPHTILLEKQPF
jgi:hypothetical protein